MTIFYHFQKPTGRISETFNKSTDTDDLIAAEPSIAFAEQDIKHEQKPSRRIKRETKPRKRTKKTKKEIDEGKTILIDLDFHHWFHEFIFIFSDEIKEEEMEIEAFGYDNDDFENDPSFAMVSELDHEQLAEDELDDLIDEANDDFGLDELKDTPRKRRRKIHVPDEKNYK